jgi:hypothetical protein
MVGADSRDFIISTLVVVGVILIDDGIHSSTGKFLIAAAFLFAISLR